ncbi:hypothetical protein [Myxosarcina sp. GI1(2024)]
MIACTPWRKGFENFGSFDLPRSSQAFLTVILPRKRAEYFIVHPENSWLQLVGGETYDFQAWVSQIFDSVRLLSQIIISQQLPLDFSQIKFVASIPSGNFINELADFYLERDSTILARIYFWQKLEARHKQKRILKLFKEIEKFESNILFNSPSAVVAQSTELKYEHILLAIINSFILWKRRLD